MSKKQKRKRRSFWEPESEKIVEWLNAQNDLGTSLQLIIVDAIKKYGDGDVIKAYLTQREAQFAQGIGMMDERNEPNRTSAPQETPINDVRVTVNETVQVPVRKSVPTSKRRVRKEQPKAQQRVPIPEVDELVEHAEVSTKRVQQQPQQVSQQVVRQERPQSSLQTEQVSPTLDEPEFDPIDVLYADVEREHAEKRQAQNRIGQYPQRPVVTSQPKAKPQEQMQAQQESVDIGDNYDPLSIMFGDVDSRLQK